jgi:hypothetical protein
MSVVGRIVMVFLAYLLACGAASIILTIGMLLPQWDDLQSLGMHSMVVWSVVLVGAVAIAGIAMLPALLVIALAEGFAWRSSLLYAALGGVLALSLSYGLDFAGYASEPGGYLAHDREVLAASGIAGGFVYWFFAGRSAGVRK